METSVMEKEWDCDGNNQKWNVPVVRGEGEEPVGQNPVVGQTDPRYLSNHYECDDDDDDD